MWQVEGVALAELRLEDVAFMECVPRYPAAERLGRQMAEACLPLWVVVGAQYFACPSLRERVLGALLNRLTVEWHGPPSQQAVELEFVHVFARSMQMTATDLVCESDDSRWDMYLEMAEERGKKKQSRPCAQQGRADGSAAMAVANFDPAGWRSTAHGRVV